MLYEYFNTTNQTSPHFERHENFVTDIQMPSCGLVQSLPHEERCPHVMRVKDCDQNVFFFHYIRFFYCTFDARSTSALLLGILLLVCLCAYLFSILAICADQFFCPSLQVLSRMLGLSENVAGVTLLAFGNSAPDFFTGIAGLHGESRRLYSDTFAASLFVCLFVGGCIAVCYPFMVHSFHFMRDACFLLLDVLFVDYAMKSGGQITLVDAILIMCIYVFYIFVVIMDHFLLLELSKRVSKDELSSVTSAITMRQEGVIEIFNRSESANRFSKFNEDMYYSHIHPRNYRLFRQFFESIIPFDVGEWRETSKYLRILLIIRIPALLGLRLLIPIVDFSAHNHGWSKLLNCIQLVSVPSFVCLLLWRPPFGLISIHVIVILITTPFAIYIFITTRTDTKPTRHAYMSIVAAIGSIFTVHAIAAELIAILEVLGITTHRSNSFLGCSLLAWGNGIGDLTADLALARQGHEVMAFAACFGGPIFNSLMLIGMSYTYKTWRTAEHALVAGEGTIGENCSIFLTVTLTFLLVAVTSTNYSVRSSIGSYMVIMYLLVLLYNLLGEFEIIHTYGTDHRLDVKAEPL